MRWEKPVVNVALGAAPSERHQAQVLEGIRMWMWSGASGPRIEVFYGYVGWSDVDIAVLWQDTLSDEVMERDGQTQRWAPGGVLQRATILLPRDTIWGLRRPWWSLDFFRQDLATVVAHEFGHALGLQHYPGGLLAEGGPGRRINSIPAIDRKKLTELYG